jgi:hypothetical protein
MPRSGQVLLGRDLLVAEEDHAMSWKAWRMVANSVSLRGWDRSTPELMAPSAAEQG